MERLTSYKNECNREMICRYEDCDTCEEHCPYLNEDNCPCLQEVLNKLAEYEDLEEQGHLIRIPCKIGDTIYVIPSEVNYKINIVNRHEELNHVYKQVVSSVGPSKCGYIIYTCDNQSLVLDEEYKETWFLTEEEAKAALRRMEEKNETN